jgi:hypothetical protein
MEPVNKLSSTPEGIGLNLNFIVRQNKTPILTSF